MKLECVVSHDGRPKCCEESSTDESTHRTDLSKDPIEEDAGDDGSCALSDDDRERNSEGLHSYLRSQLSQQSAKSIHHVPLTQSFRLSHRTSFLSSNFTDGDDQPDAMPECMSFTYLDALALFFSIGSYFFDIITDITVATLHFINENYWYFGLTVAFVAIPTVIMTCISFRWYIVDSREERSPKVSKLQWTMRFTFLLLLLSPVMRYIDSLIYGFKFRKHNNLLNRKPARQYFQYMIYEDTDATMLRLLECFMEAAPQLVLQIYILAVKSPNSVNDWTVMVQVLSVNASLVSLSWSLVSYLRLLRMSLPHKQNMTWPGTIVQFLWRLCVIASRVLALALFASEFTYYISIVCCVHWVVMFLWIVSMKTTFCDNRLEELLYDAVYATMFIFYYFNPVDRPTRWRYTFYYSFMFCENVLLLSLWYHASNPTKWYRIPALIGYFASFSLGLVFMVIYYLWLHPTGNIHLCNSGHVQADNQPTETFEPMSSDQMNGNVATVSMQVQIEDSNTKIRYNKKPSRMSNYKRQFSDVWTTQGRLLHPRPVVPTI